MLWTSILLMRLDPFFRKVRPVSERTLPTTLHLDDTPADRMSKSDWARLIQKAYEVACKDVGGRKRPGVALPPAFMQSRPDGETKVLTSHPVPDIA